MSDPTIIVNEDMKCTCCGKGGATQSGLCLKCIAKKTTAKEDRSMGSEYQQSDEVEQIAKRLIAGHHDHLRHAQIAYLMKAIDPDKKLKLPVKRVGKKSKAARAIHVPDLYHSLCGFDFVLAVDELFWRFLTIEQREALIDHELCHFAHDEDGWYIKDHDVEEFRDVLERHGFWRPELEQFVAAAPEQKSLPFKDQSKKKRGSAAAVRDTIQ